MSKLIYIVAAGHSGSTLLDLVLGTSPKIFATGELVGLPWQLSRIGLSDTNAPYAGKCTCLQSFRDCAAWSSIISNLSTRAGFDLYHNPYRFTISFLRSPQYRRIDKLSVRVRRHLVELTLRFPFLNKLYERNLSLPVQNHWSLIDSINHISHTEFVADSSKDFLRLKFLHSHRPNSIYALILIRDIRGIAYSNWVRGLDPVRAARKTINFYNRAYSIVHATKNLRYLVVRYENLCENPQLTYDEIADFLNVERHPIPVDIDTHRYHLVGGNPIRFKGFIKISADEKWKTSLNAKQQATIETMSHNMYFASAPAA